MGRQRNEFHLLQVESWIKINSGLLPEEMTQLYIKAIHAIRQRSLATLSGVTVTAVVERAVVACKLKFPILQDVTSDATGIHFGPAFEQLDTLKHDDIHQALQELLLELLDVLGKITAEILTKYLHQELMTVTNATPLLKQDSQNKRTLGIVRNREKK